MSATLQKTNPADRQFDLPQLLLDVKQAAHQLSVSQVTVYQLAKKGHLRLIKFGSRCTRVPAEDVLRLAQAGASSVSGDTEVAA